MSKNELVTRPVEGSPVPGVPVRATRVASWLGWHLFEITGVTVPAVVAVVGTPWWWLVSGVVGAGWTANEIRVTQARRRSVTGGADASRQAGSVAVSVVSEEDTAERDGVEHGAANNGDAGWTA